MNGAMYFSEMAPNGGKGVGNNGAGAKRLCNQRGLGGGGGANNKARVRYYQDEG